MKTTVREFLQAKLDETNAEIYELAEQRVKMRGMASVDAMCKMSVESRNLQRRARELTKRLKEIL